MYKGEIISLVVAVSWTVTALFAEAGSKRMGSLPLNVVRMIMSLLMLGALLWVMTGSPLPLYTDNDTIFWLTLSGIVGYVLGDFCLMNSYILIGSRFGQLFMTLSAPSAALAGWFMLGESMSVLAVAGMMVTMFGIGISVMSRGDGDDDDVVRNKRLSIALNTQGVLFAIGAAVGQGVGLVLSAKGLTCYNMSLEAHGVHDTTASWLIPFAATFVRAVSGLVGFSLWTVMKHQVSDLCHSLRDGRAIFYVLCATIFGPFVGVSLSLMATLYTSTGIAQTIMATTPVLIIVPSYFLSKQPVRAKEIVGAVIAVAGVALFFVN